MEGIHPASHFVDEVIRDIENERVLAPLREAVRSASTWREMLNAIRALYQAHERLGSALVEVDPYSLGLYAAWTPIEQSLWHDIRSTDGLRMLPQYPVGPYFLDFADPSIKVGIEADGKKYHDQARDRKRDRRLWEEFGWRVFRVSGVECCRTRQSPAEFEHDFREANGEAPPRSLVEKAARDFYLNTSAGVVKAIRALLFARNLDHVHASVMLDSLEKHRLAGFEVLR